MTKARYPREKYLKRLRPFYSDTGMIKVISGVRRCGKSCLLECVEKELLNQGVSKSSIIFINLDKRPFKSIKNAKKLEEAIDKKTKGISGKKYLLLDEIQNAKDFEESLNAYREEDDFSIFITGSNSYLLSGELSTKLTGRYIEIKMTTLTFDEYLGMKRFLQKPINPNLDVEFNSYLIEGGFPKALEYDDLTAKKIYVQSVVNEIFEKDIQHNKKIRKKRLFDEIMRYIINNFGSTTSIDKLTDYLNCTKGLKVHKEIVYRYVEQLIAMRIVDKCTRIDQKSKESLFGKEKYYLSDLSFYFIRNTDNRINYGPVLENVVYNYAKSLNYEISIGKLKDFEIDFILRDINQDYSYVQVAKTIDNGGDDGSQNSTEEREYRPLESIRDNYPKYLLTMDRLFQRRNGIKHENLVDFIASGNIF